MSGDNQPQNNESSGAIAVLINSVTSLNNKFSEFVAIEAARSEREKFQQGEIQTLQKFKEDNSEVLNRSKRWFKVVDSVGTKILTGVVIIILLSAGVFTVPKMFNVQNQEKPVKSEVQKNG